MKIEIEGYSDDNWEVHAVTSAGKHRGDETGGSVGWCKIGDEKIGGLLVLGEYAPSYTDTAAWALTVTVLGEPDDQPRERSNIVPWPVRIESGNYGPKVVIEAPDDVPLEYGTGNEALEKRQREREAARQEQLDEEKRKADEERARVLAKLTPAERRILGVR